MPVVGAESDGQVTFEWYRSPRRLLSVSIGSEGEIHYAALLGASKSYGTEPFFGEVPQVLLQLIRRVGLDGKNPTDNLFGRGDVQASVPRAQRLQIDSAPVEANVNHANFTAWPTEKPAQKMIAQEIAARAFFVPKPPHEAD